MALKVEIPVYPVYRAESQVKVDGRLDDPAWQRAPVIELVDCTTGKPPRYKTQARLLYDDQWLYVGFHCQDQDIWGTMTGHDEPIYDEEVVEIFIDPAGSLCTYYELEVSPLNTGFDALVLNNAVLTGSRAGETNSRALPPGIPRDSGMRSMSRESSMPTTGKPSSGNARWPCASMSYSSPGMSRQNPVTSGG